jgi:hypothetical protein
MQSGMRRQAADRSYDVLNIRVFLISAELSTQTFQNGETCANEHNGKDSEKSIFVNLLTNAHLLWKPNLYYHAYRTPV